MHIFYCAGEKFGEVAGVHRTLATEAPDAESTGVLSVPGSVRIRHRTPGTGRGLNSVGASSAA